MKWLIRDLTPIFLATEKATKKSYKIQVPCILPFPSKKICDNIIYWKWAVSGKNYEFLKNFVWISGTYFMQSQYVLKGKHSKKIQML